MDIIGVSFGVEMFYVYVLFIHQRNILGDCNYFPKALVNSELTEALNCLWLILRKTRCGPCWKDSAGISYAKKMLLLMQLFVSL
ncbi:UvrABC system protein C [Candidatus Doolittlea endobia]|uniref:UvrABC system protein C n=1 Tax=Candidatus Doolittlea endobia TaxID=1778262 RepID=A0A143WSU0_9ENTR|nr:UvrABC system protein C [Candidatus Doolittlea endobia]